MKLSETIEKLQQQTLVAVPDRARKAIEQENGALTDAEWAEVLASPEFKERETEMALSAYVTAIATALDSYQASVEERLSSMQNMLDVMQHEPSPESQRELDKINELVRERFGVGDGGATEPSSGGDREKPETGER